MSSIQIETDVIIVGAGPAGAGTSVFLTKAGIRHVIIEKEIFPRDKVCGDAYSGNTAFVLRKANPEWLQEIHNQATQFMPCNGMVFIAPNKKALPVTFQSEQLLPGQPLGFTAPRLRFDHFLFQKLPSPFATIFQKATIKNIEQTNSGYVRIHFSQAQKNYELTAPLIVGADGDKSEVRKKFLPTPSLKAQAVGLRAYYTGVTGLHEQNYIELHYLPEFMPGYLWIFPLPNGMVNVGVGVFSERIRKKKINLREQMLYVLNHNPHIRHRFEHAELAGKIQGWGLPMATKRQVLSGDHFLLTGDAAALIDPFTGEGIGNALLSGMIAAQAIEQSLERSQYNAAFLKQQYDDVLYKRIGSELKISTLLQQACHFPWLFNFVVNKAYKSATLHKTISCMFTGTDLRKQLRKPSFYANILLNR